MENAQVTVVITPRDRYSGIIECINNLYTLTTQAFELIVLDLDYPKDLKAQIVELLETKSNAKIFEYGLITPMAAMRKARDHIDTPYTMFLDNDSNVTEGWLPPLLELALEKNAAIVNPVTLEREGVDDGAVLRNHLFGNEIYLVNVENADYMIEHKTYRRSLPEDLPTQVCESDMFELHGVLFDTQVLKEIELPDMVIREHIDIGIQVHKMGRKIYTQPSSVVIFDNLGTKMKLSDMRFFFYRWNKSLTFASSRLFEKRWGYNFYAEQAMYHWVFRRKVFLVARWLGLPIAGANLSTRIAAKIKTTIKPVWNPLSDPMAKAYRYLEQSETESSPT